tara:strand:+ start:5138 stop:5278 length:141 start_codon:yes stop_codon:yes gene_type:complete
LWIALGVVIGAAIDWKKQKKIETTKQKIKDLIELVMFKFGICKPSL